MAISRTSPSLFPQVCNCNKYLKVSRERMRQLVENSRQASEEHSAGEWVGGPQLDVIPPSCALPWDSVAWTEHDHPPGPEGSSERCPTINLPRGTDPQSSFKSSLCFFCPVLPCKAQGRAWDCPARGDW